MKLSFVTLSVSDVGASRRFYEAFLGTTPVRQGGTHVFFNLDGTVLALFHREAMAAETGAPLPQPGATGLSWNVDHADQVHAVAERAQGAGGRVLRSAHRKPWGALAVWLADPDGHRWEIVCNPSLPRTADGGVDLR